VAVAESFLAAKVAGADDAEVYQVWCRRHRLSRRACGPGCGPGRTFPRKRPRPRGRVPGDPADPARCHVQDGPAISVSTAQMLACTAALSWMTLVTAGAVLALGRRRRAPAPRSAAPPGSGTRAGAGSRGVSPAGWTCTTSSTGVNGGRTDPENLVSLCPWHTQVVHDRGYLIAIRSGGGFTFYRPDGSPCPPAPPLPEPDGGIDSAHDADITPDTIIPPWYGERLDLDHAIWVYFRQRPHRRAETSRPRPGRRDPAARGAASTVYEPEDWPNGSASTRPGRPRRFAPVLFPTPV